MADQVEIRPELRAAVGNPGYVEGLYEQWRVEPDQVDPEWQAFFAGFEMGRQSDSLDAEQAKAQSQVASLIYAYRSLAHLCAATDPLAGQPERHPSLALERFGLTEAHLDQVYDTGHLCGPDRSPLREIIATLEDIYCRSIGAEYIHVQDRDIRRWLQAQMEPHCNRPAIDQGKQLEILGRLTDAELFETFLQRRYPGQKRFSLEGAETLIPALHAVVELAPELGLEEMVLGMAHRGRLNVLANILDKPYALLFSEFEDIPLPESAGGDGDVKYHRGFSSDHVNAAGKSLHISLTANPSHLEAVNPVVEGRTRAKQRRHQDTDERRKVVPMLIHGDAAFAGQGLVAETLNLSQLQGYRTGGTVHFIVNNQIGFTTSPAESRSSRYPTDVAKMVEAPVFHVNGDDPEAVVYVAELALRFRQQFGRDVVVDMVCYRRHGHNEGDEPAFTQPLLYEQIRRRPSVRTQYKQRLVAAGVLSQAESDARAQRFQERLEEAFDQVKNAKDKDGSPPHAASAFGGVWAGLDQRYSHGPDNTAVPEALVLELAERLNTVPPGFNINPKVGRQLKKRLAEVTEGGRIDWSQAELLAFASLLREGTPVRLSGQDSVRGTFSQRHAIWYDIKTQAPFCPLQALHPDQAAFCAYNSMLSEAAVLGFDYGYSLEEPHMLVVWEAQFGDFVNGAQVIIDQFVVASLAKWQHASGLVMLLPHGYEGQGPEHSNAYLERYLAACAQENIHICNLSTPGQYFHALRRQVRRDFRRPLVIMAPKSLLRRREAQSAMAELSQGHFQEVLDDPSSPTRAQRLVLCSGKIYYDLAAAREARGSDVALLRLEQFYPLHAELLREIVNRYDQARELLWVQEEPLNRGGWSFMQPRLRDLLGALSFRGVGRPASASPATGSFLVHQREQETIVNEALGDV